MYKRVGIKKLGKKTAHRASMIQNQMRTLFSSGLLKTTTVKAKVVKGRAESLISDMKKKKVSVDTRRKLIKILGDKELIEKSIKYSQREVVGVKIRKIGFRAGDNAEMSKLELIGFEPKKKKDNTKKEEKKELNKEVDRKDINKDIDLKGRKTADSKKVKTQRKSTERVRTRSGL